MFRRSRLTGLLAAVFSAALVLTACGGAGGSAYNNVDMQINIVESTSLLTIQANKDFQALIGGVLLQDPDAQLSTLFRGGSPGNVQGIDDPELNAALDAGREAETVEDRKKQYDIVQQRLADLNIGTFYTRLAPSVVTGKNVHGVELYGYGSQLPEELWISK